MLTQKLETAQRSADFHFKEYEKAKSDRKSADKDRKQAKQLLEEREKAHEQHDILVASLKDKITELTTANEGLTEEAKTSKELAEQRRKVDLFLLGNFMVVVDEV